MDYRVSFSSWFRYQLDRREWSQRDFARKSGLSPSTINEWFKASKIPDPSSCEKIAETFQVDPDMVLALAGHRLNTEEFAPDDPRTDLIAMVKRVQWNAERESVVRSILDSMIKAGKAR